MSISQKLKSTLIKSSRMRIIIKKSIVIYNYVNYLGLFSVKRGMVGDNRDH